MREAIENFECFIVEKANRVFGFLMKSLKIIGLSEILQGKCIMRKSGVK